MQPAMLGQAQRSHIRCSKVSHIPTVSDDYTVSTITH